MKRLSMNWYGKIVMMYCSLKVYIMCSLLYKNILNIYSHITGLPKTNSEKNVPVKEVPQKVEG